ncbi:MAG: hypothetical protein R3F59_26415 [Myxococcota bacterium]
MLLLTLLACTCRDDPALTAELAAARAEAEAVPAAPRGDGWSPDVVLHLSAQLTDRLLTRGLGDLPPIEQEVVLGRGVVLKPHLAVTRLTVDGPGAGPTCVVGTAAIGGTVDVDASVLTGAVPVEATATVEVALA